jgi:hypothetical protein
VETWSKRCTLTTRHRARSLPFGPLAANLYRTHFCKSPGVFRTNIATKNQLVGPGYVLLTISIKIID